MKPLLQAIVLAAALMFHPVVVGAAETITVYKDPG
jgi:hypothetical protein